MARKPLFETLLQPDSGNFTSIVILAIGAVAFYFLSRRKPRGGPRPPARPVAPRNTTAAVAGAPQASTVAHGPARPSAPQMSVLERIKKKQFIGSKVCVVWEIFYRNGAWTCDGKAKDVLTWYAFSSDLYIMCKISAESDESAILQVLKGVEGLQRHKILFCTTQKGYEAFARQINPALLITNNTLDAAFLSAVLPFIALVGEGSVPKPNVACVTTVASLQCDDAA